MQRGFEHHFHETRWSMRRVACLSVLVGLAGLLLVWLFMLPLPFSRALRDHEIVRFGFAGPDRYVPVVQLDAMPGEAEPMVNVGGVRPVAERKGGSPAPKLGKKSTPSSTRRSTLRGPGEDEHDLMARALADQGRVPIMQSTELIIEHLVRPEYPELARAQGIEGKVAVIALVDTVGAVVDAEVMTGSGERTLDYSAIQAVRQCVFRPYRVEGEVREVYALFRFSFRIY